MSADKNSSSPGHPPRRKYVTARDASIIYGVHPDFFRKNSETRRHRLVVSSKTHLYPVDKLDEFFNGLRGE